MRVIATGRPNRYDIEAAQHVGTIVGRSMRVLIEPKVSMARVLYLMGYATDAMRLGGATQLAAVHDLLLVMQVLYAKALAEALYGGLVRDYRAVTELLTAPRGRIDVEQLVMRRFGVFPPLDCRYDEFTIDTDANRRLLAAVRKLSRGALAETSAGAALRAMGDRFEGVADTYIDPRPLDPLRPDRRAERYRAALAYAELILQGASIDLRDGHTESVGFLVNMNEVFERFVVRALRSHLAVGGARWVHHPTGLYLDESKRFEVTPDAVLFSPQGQPVLVLDAKYKETVHGVVNDAYQMLAYCTALGLKRGVLVYARAAGEVHRIRNSDTEIVVTSIDPTGDVDQIEASVRVLATTLLVPTGSA